MCEISCQLTTIRPATVPASAFPAVPSVSNPVLSQSLLQSSSMPLSDSSPEDTTTSLSDYQRERTTSHSRYFCQLKLSWWCAWQLCCFAFHFCYLILLFSLLCTYYVRHVALACFISLFGLLIGVIYVSHFIFVHLIVLYMLFKSSFCLSS